MSADNISPDQLREMFLAHDRVHQMAEKAIDIAKMEVDRRLDGMNQLRDQINNERGVYMTRHEYEAKHDALDGTIRDLQKFQWMMTGALLVVQLLIGLVLHFWK